MVRHIAVYTVCAIVVETVVVDGLHVLWRNKRVIDGGVQLLEEKRHHMEGIGKAKDQPAIWGVVFLRCGASACTDDLAQGIAGYFGWRERIKGGLSANKALGDCAREVEKQGVFELLEVFQCLVCPIQMRMDRGLLGVDQEKGCGEVVMSCGAIRRKNVVGVRPYAREEVVNFE